MLLSKANTSTAINEPSVVNHKSTGKAAKHTVAVQPLIAPDMRSYIPFTASRFGTTQTTSSNTLRWIS
jgi:hypothetical protein